jgi:hypothetical protein
MLLLLLLLKGRLKVTTARANGKRFATGTMMCRPTSPQEGA